jgi:membrane protein implicated in regulation of membrane protease activity
MPWWAWLLLGILLLGGEMLTPGGFVLFFFGLGSLVVGILDLVGVTPDPAVQWLCFAALSVVSALIFRKPLLARIERHTPRARVDDLSGEIAVPVAEIAPGSVGRAELRGTVWSARNGTDRALAAGARCRVLRAEGLTLVLEPET